MFHKCKKHKDGLMYICKNCNKKTFQDWLSEPKNYEYFLQMKNSYRKKIRKKNLEWQKKAMRKYRKNNKEKINDIVDTSIFLTISGLRMKILKLKQNCENCGKQIMKETKRGPLPSHFILINRYYSLHHKDMNRDNNTIENILLLCNRCHLDIHRPRREVV